MKRPTIRPLRKPDLLTIYPEGLPTATRGFAVDLDGELVGLAGVMYSHPFQAFSNIKDDALRKYPRTILDIAKRLAKLMNAIPAPIYAVASPEESNSAHFLQHVGFVYVETTSAGEVYQWPTP